MRSLIEILRNAPRPQMKPNESGAIYVPRDYKYWEWFHGERLVALENAKAGNNTHVIPKYVLKVLENAALRQH